jgi:hypothetical protein
MHTPADIQPKKSLENDKPKELSCDSCGWVIKPDEVWAEKDGEITCEHCLDQAGLVGELN